MLDLFQVPGTDVTSTQDVFYGQSASNANPIPWFKPRGATMCQIFMLGGGGAGGSGFIGAAAAAGGGSGGGSAAQISMTFPLWAVPDVLFISAGFGGQPVVNGTGGAGQASNIYTALPTATSNLLVVANGGSGGVVGATSGQAAAGVGGVVSSISVAPYALMAGLITTNINIAGSNGGAGGNATTAGAGAQSGNLATGLAVAGGAGGGAIGTTGNGGAGGSNTGSPEWNYDPVPGGIASVSAGGNGRAGLRWQYSNDKRLLNSGGSGGAGSAFNSATSGGNGGDGGYGSGGAGGGAVLTGGIAGRGGNGGPGLVIITCW